MFHIAIFSEASVACGTDMPNIGITSFRSLGLRCSAEKVWAGVWVRVHNIDSCRALLPRISHSQILAGHFCQALLPHILNISRFLPGTFAKHFCHEFSYSQILAKILPGTFAKHFCHAFSYSQILAKILRGTLAKHFAGQFLLVLTLPRPRQCIIYIYYIQ